MSKAQADSQTDEQPDLAHFNLLFSQSRLRALSAFILLTLSLQAAGIEQIRALPIFVLCATGILFSWLILRFDLGRGAPRRLFCAQVVFDLAAITLGIGLAVGGYASLLLRSIFVLLIVPPALISVRMGLAVTVAATLAHEALLVRELGLSWHTLASLESTLPVFSFFVVAQQCFFYANHLKAKNEKLARLASRLTNSQRRLGGLVRVAQTLNSTLEAEDLLSRLNAVALDELRADWAATFTVDRSARTFRAVAISDGSLRLAGDAGTEFPMAAWPILDRLAHERIVAFAAAEARARVHANGRSIDRFLIGGLYREDELLGFLSVGYCAGREDAATAAFEQLGAIAENATMALRNSQLLEEARQASRLKSDFVSTISHELRTPLNVIIGYAEMLREGAAGKLTPGQLQLFEKIDTQARDLYDLIEATLQVGRMETGRDETKRSHIALPDLLASLQAVTAQLPRSGAVNFDWHVSPKLSGTLYSELGKVNLIVRNLVSNAFKFTSRGRVSVRIGADQKALVIEVADTGIGIAGEDRDKIFEMFRQLDSATTRTHGGVGLGLYIVRQMVDRLDGSIDVQSELGRGTVFTVRLPGYEPAARLVSRGAAA